jgi:hypothetical protein
MVGDGGTLRQSGLIVLVIVSDLRQSRPGWRAQVSRERTKPATGECFALSGTGERCARRAASEGSWRSGGASALSRR